jgi:NAD(P)-dependent dehydrogenase (short-subunit alcohol dehydrogenase family)
MEAIMAETKMKILLVGASGVLGRAVAAELGARHTIIAAGSKSGDVTIDIADPASIIAALDKVGPVDAVACAAGAVNFAPLSAFTAAPIASSLYGLGLASKLMGQVNLALAAIPHLADGGSITLISGVLTYDPMSPSPRRGRRAPIRAASRAARRVRSIRFCSGCALPLAFSSSSRSWRWRCSRSGRTLI